jgi:hypothetical protein
MTKLGARDRAQLVVFAYQTGLARTPRPGRELGLGMSVPPGPVAGLLGPKPQTHAPNARAYCRMVCETGGG